jgi:hypothetical protein
MLEIVEEGVREVMPIDTGASGLRWNVAEWLYSEWRLPKIDNARPFRDLEIDSKCRHDGQYDIQNICPVDEIAAI